MSNDISQPVPQGGDGAQDAENCRIAAIADELERLCAIHEAQCGDCQQDVTCFETEQRVAEHMAKANGYWIPMMNVFNLGVPGPSDYFLRPHDFSASRILPSAAIIFNW